MKNYHFDVGNSSTGPIGMCAAINATSKKDAIERFRILYEEAVFKGQEDGCLAELGDDQYIAVYINPAGLKTSHIDEVREVEDPRDGIT